jgi:hypothetical protein
MSIAERDQFIYSYLQPHLCDTSLYDPQGVPMHIWGMMYTEYMHPEKGRGNLRMAFTEHTIFNSCDGHDMHIITPEERQAFYDERMMYLKRVYCQCPICSFGKSRLLN